MTGALLLLLAIAIAGALWWTYWRPAQPPAPVQTPQTQPSSPPRPADPVPIPAPPAPPPSTSPAVVPAAITLDDFVGDWFLVDDGDHEANDHPGRDTITLRREGDRVLGRAPGGAMELTSLQGRRLTGRFLGEDRPVPMWADLSEDRDQLTIVLAPPASEYIVVVAWRVKKAPPEE